MAISVAPLFLYLSSKSVNAVITQLELEGKTEKDNTEKDAVEKDLLKDKKFFDKEFVQAYLFTPLLIENNILHNQEHALYVQTFHPIVPTPPPNV